MDEVKKMLKAVVAGQGALREYIGDEIKRLENKMDQGFARVDKRFEEVNGRIDKLGKQLAYLEDDTPTREEFDGLESRVVKVEKKIAPN